MASILLSKSKPIASVAAGAFAVFVLLTAAGSAQTFPTDEAKLYAAAKIEGSVAIYTSGPLDSQNAIAADFRAKYPGIQTDVQRIVGPALYQRFIQESQAKQYIADIVDISDQPSATDLVNQGLLAEWKIPTHDRFPDDLRIKDYVYAPDIGDSTLVYRTDKVTPDELKLLGDWKGLLDPRFKGRIALTDQSCGACYAPIHMFLDPKFKGRFGEDFIKALAAQKPAIYSDIVTIVDRVVAGEQDIAVWPAEAIPFPKWVAGAPIRWIHPKPSPVFGASWEGISSNAPHPNAARLFQDWLTSDDGGKSLEARRGLLPSLTGVTDQRTVTKEPWYDPITDKYAPDWKRWADNYDKDMKFFRTTMHAPQ